MVRVVHREQTEISLDYVNQPPHRRRIDKKTGVLPGLKLIRVIAVGFGLLCVLQVAVNVSLRLALYTTDTQTSVDQYSKQGWVHFKSSFYYVSSTKKSWQESREDCQRRGSDLVIIDTNGEQNFTRLFHELTWIGLYNDKKTGQWTWVDGTPLTNSYWGTGEPNNNFGHEMENCVEIRFHDTENSWNDKSCERKIFWICEKNLCL